MHSAVARWIPMPRGRATHFRLLPQTSEDITLAAGIAKATLNVGFLTVLREPGGYVGGYLVTNQWGRPLEFRVSTAVQPNRVQQILYGDTLEPYICGDLIGKTLVDKTGVPVQLVLTDSEAALELRNRVEFPVGLLSACGDMQVRGHIRYPEDEAAIGQLLDPLTASLDLAEPFARI